MESWDDFDGSLAGRAHGDGMDDGGLLLSGRRRGAPATRRAAPPSDFDERRAKRGIRLLKSAARPAEEVV